MAREDSYERRRFVEAASIAMLVATSFAGRMAKAKDVVNEALELWDELEHQLPKKEDR